MQRLSILRRHAPVRRIDTLRSPETPAGRVLDKTDHLIANSIPSETIISHAFESSYPQTQYSRSLSASSSSSAFFPSSAFCRRFDDRVLCLRRYSSINERDDSALEEEVEKKAGWLLKAIFLVTAFGVASQFFPYMGENLLQQSIALLHVKDPLFKRMGASRIYRFAIDDERRMKVAEMGGAHDLLTMLEGAKDDKTRKEALRTLLALSHSDAVAEVLQRAGAAAIVESAPDSSEFVEISDCKSSLLRRFRELEGSQSSLELAPS